MKMELSYLHAAVNSKTGLVSSNANYNSNNVISENVTGIITCHD